MRVLSRSSLLYAGESPSFQEKAGKARSSRRGKEPVDPARFPAVEPPALEAGREMRAKPKRKEEEDAMFSRFLNPQGGPLSQGGGGDPFSVLQREVNRAFDEVFRGFPAMGRGAAVVGGFAPSLDVRETEQGLEISAELPGMSEDDVDLRLEGDLLTLAGEKKEERTQENAGMHLTERSFGRFQRSFRLPYRPDPGQVQAQFEKGVLRITLPRPQQQQSGGRIQIQAGSGGGAVAGGAGASAGGGAQGAAHSSSSPTPAASNDADPGMNKTG
jgi:HSP20 family protein